MNDKIPASVWIVQDAKGAIWSSVAHMREDSAKGEFMRSILPDAFQKYDFMDIVHIWDIAKQNGFRLVELKVSTKASP